MLQIKATLKGRVTLWLTLLSVSLFLISGLITFLVTLSNEDAMLHNILRNASQKKLNLDAVVKEISVEQLINFGYEGASKQELTKRINSFGEFPQGDQYFHFMILKDKVLLMNSTNFVISSDKIKNILTLQLKAFIPFLLLAFFISRLIANRSLKPFSLLQKQLLRAEQKAQCIRELNKNIRESDIKQIADGIASALEQKELVLDQQISFNQGISHELRTPLQVMTHAAELIALKSPELKGQDVFLRLFNSINRMHRISEALLWLTSNVESNHFVHVNHNLPHLKADIESTFNEHRLKINIIEHNKLRLPFPRTVFEFIVYSLATNVVHHGKKNNNVKALNVGIYDSSLVFENVVDDQSQNAENRQTNFGIGLSLIEKLCQRFNVHNSVEVRNAQFVVMFKLAKS